MLQFNVQRKYDAFVFAFGVVVFALGVGCFLEPRIVSGWKSMIKPNSFEVQKIIAKPASVATATSTMVKTKVRVSRIIDGDTIEIEGGQKVRYIGMNTPETVDPRKPVQCFGKEASSRNKELLTGKEIELEKDVSETDKYGRLLRYVYLDGRMINEQLVEEGYAQVDTMPPDVKYKQIFVSAEKKAREAKLGLWGNACQK